MVDSIRDERLSVFIAPEGTRSSDGAMHQSKKLKKGAFHLALQAGVPICPVVVSGAFDVWPRHRLMPVPGEVRLRFLPPVSTAGWRRADLDENIIAVRELMADALRRLGGREGGAPTVAARSVAPQPAARV